MLDASPGSAAAPASSSTASSATGAEVASLAPRSSIWDFIQMVLVLVFVILVIYFVFRLVKKGARAKDAPAGDLVTLVSSTPLASNRYLHLVKVGPRVLLVGSSESSIGLVAEIEDKETLDAAAIEAETARGAPKKDFSAMLGQLLGSQKHPKNQAGPMDFIKRQRERLKRFK